VRTVARLTIGRPVNVHDGDVRLRFGVTADARWCGLPGCKRVTGEAIGWLGAAAVGLPCLLRVTARADRDLGLVETRTDLAVAVAADDRSFSDVLAMPNARSVLGP